MTEVSPEELILREIMLGEDNRLAENSMMFIDLHFLNNHQQ